MKAHLKETDVEYIRLKPYAGAHVARCIREAAILALQEDVPVSFAHNGVEITIHPEDLVTSYMKAYDALRKEK